MLVLRVECGYQVFSTGTYAYTAPEVLARGRRALSSRSDMYSMGMLLFHVVEELPPWRGEDYNFIKEEVTRGELPERQSEEWPESVVQLFTVRF